MVTLLGKVYSWSGMLPNSDKHPDVSVSTTAHSAAVQLARRRSPAVSHLGEEKKLSMAAVRAIRARRILSLFDQRAKFIAGLSRPIVDVCFPRDEYYAYRTSF